MSEAREFKFVNALPEEAQKPQARSRRFEEAKVFRSHPNQWASYYTAKSVQAAQTYASNLRRGQFKPFPNPDPEGGQWESANAGTEVFIRYAVEATEE